MSSAEGWKIRENLFGTRYFITIVGDTKQDTLSRRGRAVLTGTYVNMLIKSEHIN